MKFEHVTDPELRAHLAGEVDSDPDFVCRETIKAWELDSQYPEEFEPASFEARESAYCRIVENWGDGEEGDALAVAAARRYWSA